MVVASGILEVKGRSGVDAIVLELRRRGLEVDDLESEHIVFIVRRESIEEIRAEVASLQGLDNVHNVHITYYSHEEPGSMLPPQGA
jgi:nitrate reductase NapAB chaperone NapD